MNGKLQRGRATLAEGVEGIRGGVVWGTSQTRSDSTVTVYLPEYVRGSGAAASVGGAGGAEALTEGFVDPPSSTTVASWITIYAVPLVTVRSPVCVRPVELVS